MMKVSLSYKLQTRYEHHEATCLDTKRL